MKKNLKIDTDKRKSFMVLVCFLVVSSLFFYRNLEAHLKGFYANRNFWGEIKITGFSWAEENWGIDVNYTYTEKIKDKTISVPVKKSVRFKQLVMPYYDKMDIDKWRNPIYDESMRVYAPILEKALEINPERTKLEQSLTRKLNQASHLKGGTVKLRSTLSDQNRFGKGELWYSDRMEDAVSNNHSILEELYNVPLNDALSHNAVYVQIILPEERYKEHFYLRDQIQQLLEQLSLPDGTYVLETIDETNGDFVVVEQGKIIEGR
ncbi:hypothetical protein HMPREF9422_0857 [Streptococcus cristatus ATCC 51100]|uniref:Uncharacterized protein n=1 Tax=Streptococcus cristatus ATCC 51100 TaxID=889201 RepID=A0AAV3EE07_STRCR|nr:hypothetical protein [Streptococcus cristatus]EFX53051.1 hypothetical protein HMPREF9422_0857 [Streptococcus cristatus ATCC 51100]EGU66992.1 hypothetical protein HMPREF9960_1553 [Streptococcus cristatus ATCC 51100]KJQ57382.1 hypothetical protein TZ85_01720 [Streptococcus cristatus]RSJ73555.1 hypothetical protein D8799_04680 [Streptococcus cristatus]RSJ74482.1 hypothetical protein D8797_03975 [Streptococcus cristatus]